jgi:hypothetical protein
MVWVAVGVGVALFVVCTASAVTWVDRARQMRIWRTRPEEQARASISAWARARSFELGAETSTSIELTRGAQWKASFAFGLAHVPARAQIRWLDGITTAELRFASPFQLANATDVEEADLELTLLEDALERRVSNWLPDLPAA